MKFLKNIFLLFFIFCNDQLLDASQFLYKKNIAHNSPQSAQRLTEESLITPEMQWSILSFLGASHMTINRVTGQVQGLPSVEALLMQMNQKLSQPMYSTQKESLKQAAHALLEATDVALFVTSIEAVYQPYNVQSTNQLLAQLNAQKQTLNNTIAAINKIKTTDSAPSSSYFSWIPYFGSGSGQPVTQISSEQISFDPSSPTVDIPASLMPTIIKINNYKEMSADPVQAANLLFKECFIAQQHHLKDNARIENLKINLQSPISAQNYIFTQFPNLYNSYTGTYPICQIAQQMVASQAPRYDLQAPVTTQQEQAHQLLLHIRQAIQTALYIANKKSSYNAGSMLSSSITSWLDGIVSQLMKADAQLAQLCKDPLYGATQADIDLDGAWSTNAKIAAGLIVTAGVIAATLYFNPLGTGAALTKVGSVVYSGASTTAGAAKSAASSLIPSAVSNMFGSTPAPAGDASSTAGAPTQNTPIQGPQLPNSQTTDLQTDARFLPSSATSAASARATDDKATGTGTSTWWKTTKEKGSAAWQTATDLSGYAIAAGGGIATASQIAKHVAPEQYKKIDQNYLGGNANKIEFAAASVAAVGAGVAGINQIGGAYNTLRDSKRIDPKTGAVSSRGYLGFLGDSWSLFSTAATTILFGLPRAGAAAAGLTALAVNEFGQFVPQLKPMPAQPGQQYQAQTQAPAQIQQMNSQQLYQGLIAMAQDASEKNMDPFQSIAAGLQYVSENNIAAPEVMYEVLQKMRDEAATSNRELANNLNTIVQAFEQDFQNAQNQQAAPAA